MNTRESKAENQNWLKPWLLIVAVSSFQLSAFAQCYAIDWHTIDGGGGTSTGGVYTVTGTIGQPDAGTVMTGGNFSLQGGFWVLPQAVQTENAPTLTIVPDTMPNNAMVSWTPATGTNWVLQETSSLSPPAWTNSPSGYTNSVAVPVTFPARYYRLNKP